MVNEVHLDNLEVSIQLLEEKLIEHKLDYKKALEEGAYTEMLLENIHHLDYSIRVLKKELYFEIGSIPEIRTVIEEYSKKGLMETNTNKITYEFNSKKPKIHTRYLKHLELLISKFI
ncbi:MAG: hypothetical protein RSE41_09040 [Clostridia bacterium]